MAWRRGPRRVLSEPVSALLLQQSEMRGGRTERDTEGDVHKIYPQQVLYDSNSLESMHRKKIHYCNESKRYRRLSDDHNSWCFTLWPQCKPSSKMDLLGGQPVCNWKAIHTSLIYSFSGWLFRSKLLSVVMIQGERSKEQRSKWRLDAWHKGSKTSNNLITCTWTVFLNAWFQSGEYHQRSKRVIGWARNQ